MEDVTPECGVEVAPARRWGVVVRFLCVAGILLAVIGAARAADLTPATQSLFDAVQRNDLAAVQISVANGADLSARNSLGMLPVDLAVEKGHFEVAHYLLSLRQIEDQGKEADTAGAPAPAAQPAPPRQPVQSDVLSAQPTIPPSPPATLPGPAADPFDPMAVPETARHPVITGPGTLDPTGGIAEPPPPPAVPEDVHSQAAPQIRPKQESPDVADLPSPARPTSPFLNRLGAMLERKGEAGEPSQAAAPPPQPPVATAAPKTPEPAPDVHPAPLKTVAKAKEETPVPVEAPKAPDAAEAVPAPEPTPAAADLPVAKPEAKAPEPDVAAVEPESAEAEPDLEVEDSLDSDLAKADFAEPVMQAAPPPPPLLTPPLLDSGGKFRSFVTEPRLALDPVVPPATVPAADVLPEAAADVAKESPERPSEPQVTRPVDMPSSGETAESLPESTKEPAEEPRPAVTAAVEEAAIPVSEIAESAKPSMIARVTEDFDQTFEHFLGGWFFKWVGQKMGMAKPANETEAKAQSSPQAGAAVAISQLAPRDEPQPLPPEPPVPAATPSPTANALPDSGEVAAPEEKPEPVADTVAETPPPAEPVDPTASGETAEIASLPDSPVEMPDAPVEQPRNLATPTPAMVGEKSAPADAGIPAGLLDGLRIVAAAPEKPSALPASEPELGGLDATVGPEPADTTPAKPDSGPDIAEIGGLDALPDAVAETKPAPKREAKRPAAGTKPVPKKVTARPAASDLPSSSPADSSTDDQLAELGDLGIDDQRLNPVRAAGADAFAPTAVPPGSKHPVIGDVAPEPPKPEPSLDDLDMGDSLAALPQPEGPSDGGKPSGLGELDSLAAELGTDALTDGKAGDGTDGLMSRLSQFLEADDPLTKGDAGKKQAPSDGLSELAALASDVGVVATAPVPATVARQLPETVLTLGESIHLTSLMPDRPDDPSEANYCVEKNRNNIVFCVEPVDWPPDLIDHLRVSTIMYQGTQAVVRYDDGQATRFHAIFPTSGFEPLIAYYARRFGPPTEIETHKIAPFGRPRQENPVYIWRRDDPLSGKKTTLEVRQYDDGRGGFPDLRHGAVMLYNDASQLIFPVLSALDLMPTTGTN